MKDRQSCHQRAKKVSCRAVDLDKLLQCGSTGGESAKLVEDISSEYCDEPKAVQSLEYFGLKKMTDNSLGQSLLQTDLLSNLEVEEYDEMFCKVCEVQ